MPFGVELRARDYAVDCARCYAAAVIRGPYDPALVDAWFGAHLSPRVVSWLLVDSHTGLPLVRVVAFRRPR